MRRGLLARTLFETLRDTGEPLAPKDALALVASRVPPNKQELSHNASGFPRYETYLCWVSTWGSAIGWMAKRGGWSITEAGVEALAESAGDEFVSDLTRRYRLHRKQTQQKQPGYGDPRWAEVVKALGCVEAGGGRPMAISRPSPGSPRNRSGSSWGLRRSTAPTGYFAPTAASLLTSTGLTPTAVTTRGRCGRQRHERGNHVARLGIDRDFLWEFGKLERAIQEKVHAGTRARENLMVSWHEIPSRLFRPNCARNG